MEQRSTKTIHYRNRKIISYNLNLTSTTISFICIDLQRGKQENERSYCIVRACQLKYGVISWQWCGKCQIHNFCGTKQWKYTGNKKSYTILLRSMVFQAMIKTKRRDKRVLQQLLMKTYRLHYNNQFEKT